MSGSRRQRDIWTRRPLDRRRVQFDYVTVLAAQRVAALTPPTFHYTRAVKTRIVRAVTNGTVSFAEASAVHNLSAEEFIEWRRPHAQTQE